MVSSQDNKNSISKGKTCLNCASALNDNENYCPNCGQANNTKRVSFKDLVIDILGYFFFYDFKLKNSLKLLFFHPGQLSLNFIRGKKVDYIHPIRLYFIVSLIFFALSSINSREDKNSDVVQLHIDNNQQVDSLNFEDGVRIYKLFGISGNSRIDSSLIVESRTSKLSLLRLLTIEMINNQSSKSEIFGKYNIEGTYLNNYLYSKAKYATQESVDSLEDVFQKKFKLLLFIFLPFFVVFMYLFHSRKDYYYYENLIFAFNTQTALFLFLIIEEIFAFISEGIGDYVSLFIFFILFPVYLFIALKRFYGYKTFMKASLMFILINSVFLISSALFFIISFIGIYLIA